METSSNDPKRVFSSASTRFDDGVVDRLLAPMGFTALMKDYFGHRPLVIGGFPGKLDGLFGWDDVNDTLRQEHFSGRHSCRSAIMDDAGRPRSSLEVDPRTVFLRRNETEAQERDSGLTSRSQGHLSLAQIQATVRDAANLQLVALNETSPSIMRLAEYLEAAFHESFEISAVANGGNVPGFPLHFDTIDSFICQVSGRQRWTLFGPTVESPRMDQRDQRAHLARVQAALRAGADAEPEAWREVEAVQAQQHSCFVLDPGDVLYLPAGWWHLAEPVEEPTLYLSCDFRPVTGVGLLAALAATSPVLRRRLPRFGDAREQQEFLAGIRAELAELGRRCRDLAEFFAVYDGEASAPKRPALPWSVASRPLSPRMRLRWNPLRPVRITVVPATEELHFLALGQEWTLRGGAEVGKAILGRLQARRVCTLDEIMPKDCLRGFGAGDIEAFLRDLVSRGLLSVVGG